MAAVERPFPPGAYDVVVVGSGPGGLQTSYYLDQLGVRHALLSADEKPGGMFCRWPIFDRLISWSKPDAPVSRRSAEYERYDHNSLVAEDGKARALVPEHMSRESVFPTRAEMEAGLRAFAERAQVPVRHACRWESTRPGETGFVLGTSDGEYSCRLAVFAVGMTEAWKPSLLGVDLVPHYAQATADAAKYRDRSVVLIGKRNSALELADGLLPWAQRIVLVSPRPAETDVLAHATVRPRYFQPLEEHQTGGGVFALDASIDRIERAATGFRVSVSGTTSPGKWTLEADAVIATTGFRVPLGDLPALGVHTVAEQRMPALNPYWESISVPDIFFAGNATVGAVDLRRHGVGSGSTSVKGFRYNARVLAWHIAERLGRTQAKARALRREDVPPLLARELVRRGELWAQKAYLARVFELEPNSNARDCGIQPLAHFVDVAGPDAVAATIETDRAGVTFPAVYLRRRGSFTVTQLDPHPLNEFDSESYQRALAALIG